MLLYSMQSLQQILGDSGWKCHCCETRLSNSVKTCGLLCACDVSDQAEDSECIEVWHKIQLKQIAVKTSLLLRMFCKVLLRSSFLTNMSSFPAECSAWS